MRQLLKLHTIAPVMIKRVLCLCGMMLIRKTQNTRRKPIPLPISPLELPTWTGLEMNQVLHGEMSVTRHLIRGADYIGLWNGGTYVVHYKQIVIIYIWLRLLINKTLSSRDYHACFIFRRSHVQMLFVDWLL